MIDWLKSIFNSSGAGSTHYQSNAEEMKSRLDSVSPSMCLAKWQQVNIHLTTGRTQSCFHPPTHKIPAELLASNPSVLHNTPFKKEERAQMKRGKRPKGCSYCWKVEDTVGAGLSDRFYRSSESWASEHFEKIEKMSADEDVTPSHVEVNFNHACNFKCSYCSPHISSQWLKEIEEHGPYPTSNPHNDLNWVKQQGLMPIKQSEPNPYREAFWQWWPEMYPHLKHFRMTGSEPLMDINTYKVLEYVFENPKNDLTLEVTSNFCVEEPLFEKFIAKTHQIDSSSAVKHFGVYASIDNWNEKSEYVRYGMNFERFVSNVHRFLKETKNTSICFINTFNNLSVLGFNEMLEAILYLRSQYSQKQNRVRFNCPILTFPDWQSLQTLPKSFWGKLERDIEFMERNRATRGSSNLGFRDFEINQIKRNYEIMRSPLPEEELKRRRADFYKFFSEYDRRRNTDFTATFSNMKSFWDICKEEAEQ